MQGQEGKALEKPSSLYTCFVCVWFVMACIMGCLLLVGGVDDWCGFGDKETAKTEYVLAGTLLSILIAVLAGMMVIGVLKP